MQDIRGPMRGIWLPLVTPMRDGEIDAASIRRLAAHYASEPIDGVIVAATTGEGLALSPDETRMLAFEVREAFDAASRRMPVWLGMAGADTRAVAARLESSADWPVDGYLVSCPFYVRPSQEGLKLHFSALAGATDRPLAVYNIPYRTGVNIDNATLFALAGEHRNIRAVKDCSALPAQSAELAAARPGGFSVMTGEDAAFFDALCHGADGGIL
ncbi:MAG: dihydrodipicolinate synthase family protein, partial [Flavobacteriaceae bacterium]